MTTHVPQTVRFEMRIRFDEISNRGDREKTFVFHDFDKMIERVRTEKRRRANADRMTSATYRMHLTAHGKDVCRNDADAAKRHEDAIDGRWMTWN